MFTILGGDGKEYGPASAEQLRGWIKAGRANLETQARAAGTDEWRRLGDFAEFAAPDGLPPVIGGVAPAASAPAAANLVAADRGTRLGARLIDWFISIVCVIPGAFMLGGEFMKVAAQAAQGKQPDLEQLDIPTLVSGGLVMGAGWLFVLVIQVVLLSKRGQSIGKFATGLRIVLVADGSQAGFVHGWLLREALITFIAVILSLVPFLGPLFLRPCFHLTDWCMIFRDDGRCLHDLIAGTRVVKA
jgi:uncharacterized RDD family membrane protein YckC